MTTREKLKLLAAVPQPEGAEASYYSDANAAGEYRLVFLMSGGGARVYRVNKLGRVCVKDERRAP